MTEGTKFIERAQAVFATVENKIASGVLNTIGEVFYALDRADYHKYVSFSAPNLYDEKILEKYKEKILCWGYPTNMALAALIQINKFCHVKLSMSQSNVIKDKFGYGVAVFCKNGQDYLDFIKENEYLEIKPEERRAGFLT